MTDKQIAEEVSDAMYGPTRCFICQRDFKHSETEEFSCPSNKAQKYRGCLNCLEKAEDANAKPFFYIGEWD